MNRFVPSRALLFATITFVVSVSTVFSGYELVLEDGRVLEGFDLQLRDGNYFLTLENEEVLALPAQLVTEVRLNDQRSPKEEAEAATGITVDSPRALAGPMERTEPPTTSEQLGAFNRPGNQFQKSPIDPNWRPKSAFDPGANVLADSESKWVEPPIDPNWKPESAYTQASDVSDFNPSQWAKSSINNSWAPTDGFKKSKTSYSAFGFSRSAAAPTTAPEKAPPSYRGLWR